MALSSDKRPEVAAALGWTSVVLVGGLVFLGPVFGGLQGASHWPLGAAVGVAAGAAMLSSRATGRRAFRADPLVIVLSALAGLFVFQLVPLPAGLVGVLSPSRLGLARELASVSGLPGPAWLPITACPKHTRDGLLLFVGAVSVFYAASRQGRLRGSWRIPLAAAAAAGALLAVYGLGALVFGEPGPLAATYTNRNRFAGFLAVAGASAVGLYVVEREPGAPAWRRALPLAAAVLIEIALVFTLSRLGIAAAALAGLLTVALVVRRRAVWGAFAGVLCLVALNVLLGIAPVLERYSLLFEAGRGRLQAWSMSLPMALDYPVFGSGEATYRQLFALYQKPSLPGWWVNAHNDYLTVLTEGGLLALGGLVAAAILFFRRIAPMRLSPVRTDNALAVTGFLAVTAELIHSVGDYPLRQPANLLAFAAVGGVVYGRASRREASGRGESGDVPSAGRAVALRLALAGILCVVAIPALWVVHRTEDRKAAASELASTPPPVEPKALGQAVALLESAAATDPWDADARYETARLRVAMIPAAADPEETRRLAEQAVDDVKAGLRVSPLDPRPYYLLGILTWTPGAADARDRMMETALRLGRAWHDVSYNVGVYFLRRWRIEMEARSEFGLTRWQAGRGSELLKSASSALTLAVRSPKGRRRVVELVLAQPLFSSEIDRLLDPDREIDAALARGLARLGRHAEAEPRFARALGIGDDLSGSRPPQEGLAGLHAAYAQTLLELGRTGAALDQFGKSLAAASPGGRADCVQLLGRLRVPRDSAGAVADWWSALPAWTPELEGEAALLLALGRAELAAGRVESGTRHLTEYAGKTRDASAYAELAAGALARGKPKLAVEMASEAERLEPRAGHQLLLSRAFKVMGCETEAVSALRQALALDPRNLPATRGLARMDLSAGRPDQAARLWKRFLESGGDRAAGHEGLADVHSAVMDYDTAAEELRRALSARPGDARLMKKLRGLSGK
jgi:tetratricopeptide (TPR) repeat protein